MNFGKNENIRVKHQIVDGLFELLEKQTFSEISISNLVAVSKVARASYYRNFSNKEEILEFYFFNLRSSDINEIASSSIIELLSADNGLKQSIEIFYKERHRIKLLLQNNLGDYIFRLINERVLEVAGDMSTNSIDRYKLYFYSGAMYSVLINWIEDGTKESAAQLSDIIINYLSNGISQ